MSEFIATMGGGYGRTEHNSRRVLVGDMENVRQRLAGALEKLGYLVVSEDPLVAKNSVQPSSFSGQSCVGDVLHSPIRLTIGLRHFNENSTLATFDYSIMNSMVTKGDRQTLEREIEALIALAVARPEASVCAACGTNLTNDSRFCRACGAPNSADEPAEVEVLRLTAGTRAAYQSIFGGVLSMLGVLALALPLIFFARKGPRPGTIFLIIGELCAFAWLLYGIVRLHLTLNPRGERRQALSTGAASARTALETSALPPLPAHTSITEGTTELLPTPPERVAVPVNRQSRDTGPIN